MHLSKASYFADSRLSACAVACPFAGLKLSGWSPARRMGSKTETVNTPSALCCPAASEAFALVVLDAGIAAVCRWDAWDGPAPRGDARARSCKPIDDGLPFARQVDRQQSLYSLAMKVSRRLR